MLERQESGKTKHMRARVRREVLTEGRCAYCGEDFYPLTVDHIIPVSQGGTSDRSNLTAACWPCNYEKLDRTPEQWRSLRRARGLEWPPVSKTKWIIDILKQEMPTYLAEMRQANAALTTSAPTI
jgi:5-methylcytosine-specific restriction endonuclease McrA